MKSKFFLLLTFCSAYLFWSIACSNRNTIYDSDYFSDDLNDEDEMSLAARSFRSRNSSHSTSGIIHFQPDRVSLTSHNTLNNTTNLDITGLTNLLSESGVYVPTVRSCPIDQGSCFQLIIGLAFDFDTDDVIFLNYIRKLSFENFPVGTSYYGKFIDPEDGTLKYFLLPISISVIEDSTVHPGSEESDFIIYMQINTTPAKLHLNFPDQEILFSRLFHFADCAPLTYEHLRAFEVDFPNFLFLILKYPQKYFLPALALSLQYDQDFYKFFNLFFVVKNHYPIEIDYQHFFLNLFLEMRIISNLAFDFFSNCRNAVFFFSEFVFYPCYYGKFSPHTVANILSSYTASPDQEYSRNPLRSFILNFSYSLSIDLYHHYKNFSRTNLKIIFQYEKLFNNIEDFHTAIYLLYRSAIDESVYFPCLLLEFDKVKEVLKVALKREDLFIVRNLFLNFDLENDTDQVSFRQDSHFRSSNPYFTVKVKRINNRFCSVQVINGIKTNITLLLPLK